MSISKRRANFRCHASIVSWVKSKEHGANVASEQASLSLSLSGQDKSSSITLAHEQAALELTENELINESPKAYTLLQCMTYLSGNSMPGWFLESLVGSKFFNQATQVLVNKGLITQQGDLYHLSESVFFLLVLNQTQEKHEQYLAFVTEVMNSCLTTLLDAPERNVSKAIELIPQIKALIDNKEVNKPLEVAALQTNMGSIALHQKQFQVALDYLYEALKIYFNFAMASKAAINAILAMLELIPMEVLADIKCRPLLFLTMALLDRSQEAQSIRATKFLLPLAMIAGQQGNLERKCQLLEQMMMIYSRNPFAVHTHTIELYTQLIEVYTLLNKERRLRDYLKLKLQIYQECALDNDYKSLEKIENLLAEEELARIRGLEALGCKPDSDSPVPSPRLSIIAKQEPPQHTQTTSVSLSEKASVFQRAYRASKRGFIAIAEKFSPRRERGLHFFSRSDSALPKLEAPPQHEKANLRAQDVMFYSHQQNINSSRVCLAGRRVRSDSQINKFKFQ